MNTGFKNHKLNIPNRIKNNPMSGTAGIIGPVLFISIMCTLDIVQWETNPVLNTISDLVHGNYGWLQTISFVMLGILLFAFASRLYAATRKKISCKTGLSFFSITSIGFLLIAVFPSQISGIGITIQGLIHNSIAGVISGSFIVGCIAFAIHFRKDPYWKSYWIYTLLTVIICLASAFSWALTESQVKVLSERLLLTSGMIWMIVVSIKIIRTYRKPQQIPAPISAEEEEEK